MEYIPPHYEYPSIIKKGLNAPFLLSLATRQDAGARLNRANISPTMPRLNANTQIMKIRPVTIVTESPSD